MEEVPCRSARQLQRPDNERRIEIILVHLKRYLVKLRAVGAVLLTVQLQLPSCGWSNPLPCISSPFGDDLSSMEPGAGVAALQVFR